MLSRPFRGMARGVLVPVVLLLVALEVAGGFGLYLTTRADAVGAVHRAALARGGSRVPPPAPVLKVHNSPRTVTVGQTELFSVRITDLANKLVTYVVAYPDGTVDKVLVKSDVSGFSQYPFRILYHPHDRREAIGIGVYYKGAKRAFTEFAVQLPMRRLRP